MKAYVYTRNTKAGRITEHFGDITFPARPNSKKVIFDNDYKHLVGLSPDCGTVKGNTVWLMNPDLRTARNLFRAKTLDRADELLKQAQKLISGYTYDDLDLVFRDEVIPDEEEIDFDEVLLEEFEDEI